jgi:hypothetical protein
VANPIDNIPPEKRGNPAWVKGGDSPNPGGRPKKLVAIERMLDEEHRTPENMRAVFQILRDLATNGVTVPVFDKGMQCGEKTTFHPGYMELYLNRVMGPAREPDIDFSDADDETLAYLRDKLRLKQ